MPAPHWLALVAELVDALASGASFCMEVEVRVFSRAPFFEFISFQEKSVLEA